MANTNIRFKTKKTNTPLRFIVVVVILIVAAAAFFYFRSGRSDTVAFTDTLKVHYSPSYAGEESIIKYIGEHIAPDYGIKVEAVALADGTQADRAVAEGRYAGTIIQHQWWLKRVIEANGFELTPTVEVFQWSFAIYADKHKSIDELPNGAVIAIPIDGANQGQALWLLEREGLIGLDGSIEPRTAKIKDVAYNPRNFKFKELELATVPRVLDSIDAGISYVSLFDAGKIPRDKGILFPQAPRTFASRLVIGTKFLNDPYIIKLQQAFSDPRVREYLATTDDPLVQGVLTPVSDE
jgi:ABC-type metal ion transport system substrate-binding protein